MSKVKFISVTFLKANTTIQDNIDDNILVPYIYKVQDIYLQQILGTTFYEDLKSKISTDTLNGDETVLITDYIQNMVAEYTFYEVIPHINYKMTNKSVSQQSSEHGNPSQLSDIKYLRSSVLDMAQFYAKRLTKYLCDNSNLFPIYNNPDSNENLSKSGKTYFNGIFIPRRNNVNGFNTYDDPSK